MSDIFIAPFSNSNIRDWPVDHFRELTGLLLDRWESGRIRIVGAPTQRLPACDIVRPFPATRVVNECGRLSWDELLVELRRAACVVGNNSGIAHLTGFFGVPTVCVFGGSHQRLEWRPMGASVVILSRVIGCSPCHQDHGGGSFYAKACLREISPMTVTDAVFLAMDRAREARGEAGDDMTAADQDIHLQETA